MDGITSQKELARMRDKEQEEPAEGMGINPEYRTGRPTSFRGVPVEIAPLTGGQAVRVSTGPLAAVRDEARATVRAYLSYLNAFRVKDGIFEMTDEGTVTFRLEADDPSSPDRGVGTAVGMAGTTAERLSEPIRALSAGLLTLSRACWKG